MAMLPQALLLVLLFHTGVASSSSIINTLPGFFGDLPFKLETGYVGVGDLDEVQLFYYFAESEGSPEHDPLMLWLSGGPGCSGFHAFVYGSVGSLSFDYAESGYNKPKLKLNPYSYTKVANVIFLDAPVGTGFSYAKTWKGYTNMSATSYAAQTYQFLKKWFLDHPKFLNNPLYIGAESYSGIVLPIVVKEISDGNEEGDEPPMNLKGYVLGNAGCDSKKDMSYTVPFSHLKALISDELYQSTKRNCNENYTDVDPSNVLCLDDMELVNECVEDINPAHILEPKCTYSSPNHLSNKHSVNLLLPFSQLPRQWCRKDNYIFSEVWANDKAVQNALHIREGTIKEWVRCNKSLSASYIHDVSSSLVYHEYLIKKGYRVLVYSGDQDMMVPYLGTIDWIESLNLNVTFPWKPWLVNGQVAGYRVQYTYEKYHLTFTTIKGAGHVAPEYKPEECLAMVRRWFAYDPL
ncbi:hypothetical protein ACE6H2_027569 [Prunus campanulata]